MPASALTTQALRDLNRGGPAGPRAVRRILERLGWFPEETPQWLPVLGAALRSVRGPAWRDALAAVVGWVERHPEDRERVRGMVPELNWCETAAQDGTRAGILKWRPRESEQGGRVP